MDITKCITVSTAHVSEDTIGKLKQEPVTNKFCLAVYEKGEFGFWIYIPEYIWDMKHSLPEDLYRCMALAKEHNCEWLCLDRDGEEVAVLPTYDW